MDKEKIENGQHFDEDKKISKWTKRIFSLFLVSDIKNPKLRSELRDAKKDIVKNFDGSNIQSQYINRLFWIYNKIDKDVYIPLHLKKHISKFNVKIAYDDKIREINLQEYFLILKHIRSSLVYLKTLQSDIHQAINFHPDDEIRTSGEASIRAEQENISTELYKKRIYSEITTIEKKISTGDFNLIDIVQLYVFSLGEDKNTGFSFKKYVTQNHMEKEFTIGDMIISLKDFIRILKDIDLENNTLS